MEWYTSFAIVMGALLILLALGMPIAFAMGIVGACGLFLIGGWPFLSSAPFNAFGILNSFPLIALPLFVMLGVLLSVAGVSADIYRAIEAWFGWIPGIKGVATIGGCALFAAACGSSTATAVAMGKVGIPEMNKSRYDINHATAIAACGGTLGVMIPPSILMIIYGNLAEVSVGRLFMGGIIPGIITATLFSTFAIFYHRFRQPEAARLRRKEVLTLKMRFIALIRLLPFLFVILAVIGSMYAGIATPSESAALGTAIAFFLALAYRKLSYKAAVEAGLETVLITAFVALLIVTAIVFGALLARLRIPMELASLAAGLALPPEIIVGFIGVLLIILGTFMEGLSITVLTVPLFVPIVRVLGVDLLWFGVFLILTLQIGQITPPVGINLYAAVGIGREYGATLEGTLKSSLPFLLVLCLVMVIIIIEPDLVMFIPGAMG